MFTGIVEKVGRVVRVQGDRLVFRGAWHDLKTGESVAVNGVCLTVVEVADDIWSADVSPETRRRSTLGNLRVGDAVNLERALSLGDRLGGHLVQGHVDEVGTVVGVEREGEGLRMEIAVFTPRYLAEKGSVAVDGVSLTVASLTPRGFSVVLIPFTLRETTLGKRRVGDHVNLEYDVLAKYVESLLVRKERRLDETFLSEHGYLG